eukprot:1271144-Rhodomonas_salina.1
MVPKAGGTWVILILITGEGPRVGSLRVHVVSLATVPVPGYPGTRRVPGYPARNPGYPRVPGYPGTANFNLGFEFAMIPGYPGRNSYTGTRVH